ncbi:MAG: hypothetical protein PHX72_01050 [Candidatus Shapirobacteria bacterium]|nr:hypothetical protein [Candidatus Shapirobacteria bacterium]
MALNKKNQITAILITDQLKKQHPLTWCDKVITIKPSDNDIADRNLALKQAVTRWVIFLKDRETVSQSLIREIKNFVNSADRQGYTGGQLVIKKVFAKKILNHGTWTPKKEIRLGRRVGKWVENRGQASWQFPGQKIVFFHPLIDKPYEGLTQMLVKINSITTKEAQKKHYNKQTASLLTVIFSPIATFKKVFFLKLGFLDGLAGFNLAVLTSFQAFLEKSKLWLLNQQEKNKEVMVDN